MWQLIHVPLKEAPHTWNREISRLPQPHFLQTWEWAQVKAQFGWQPHALLWREGGKTAAAALALARPVRLGGFSARLSVIYVPKGPLLEWENQALAGQVLGDLDSFSRSLGAIFLKVDPDISLGRGEPISPEAEPDLGGIQSQALLQERGFHFSAEQIQFRNTVLIDLTQDEEAWLQRMKQKTRYNIRLAQRKGVQVRRGNERDIPLLYRMYAETSARDGFVIRDAAYYRCVWATFFQAGLAEPLIAQVAGEPVAALVLFTFAQQAWYVYGMSTLAHRERMPNYLLQWEAMRLAREKGCLIYDLWGAPEVYDESDPLWGVYRFKVGLGGQVRRALGAYDLPLKPWFYRLYVQALPWLLQVMRRRGIAVTRRLLSN